MPFMIQFMKDYVGKVDTLMADRKENMEARKVSCWLSLPFNVIWLYVVLTCCVLQCIPKLVSVRLLHTVVAF